MGFNIQERDTQFVAAYFSKIFSIELSTENQEHMSIQDKFHNLERLYNYAKQRNLPGSLISNLLHEMLLLSIQLDNYIEDIFKEYMKRPLEYNTRLKDRNIIEKK